MNAGYGVFSPHRLIHPLGDGKSCDLAVFAAYLKGKGTAGDPSYASVVGQRESREVYRLEAVFLAEIYYFRFIRVVGEASEKYYRVSDYCGGAAYKAAVISRKSDPLGGDLKYGYAVLPQRLRDASVRCDGGFIVQHQS